MNICRKNMETMKHIETLVLSELLSWRILLNDLTWQFAESGFMSRILRQSHLEIMARTVQLLVRNPAGMSQFSGSLSAIYTYIICNYLICQKSQNGTIMNTSRNETMRFEIKMCNYVNEKLNKDHFTSSTLFDTKDQRLALNEEQAKSWRVMER